MILSITTTIPGFTVKRKDSQHLPKKKKKRKGKQNISSLSYYIGVPVVAQWVKNPTCLCKDEGWIPSIAQCIKDPVLSQAVEQVTAAAQRSVLPWLWLRQTAAAPNSPPSP